MADPGSLRGAAALQRGSETLVAVARGLIGTGPETSCTLDTPFQIASVTKQFPTSALLLLADRCILSVDDPVRRWLSGCPPAWDRITVHHLLSHSAGLVQWPQLTGLDLTRPVNQDGTAVPSSDLDTLGLGTGSIWSTVGDLARWDRALAGGEILSPAARDAMFTVHMPIEDDDGLVRTEGYGYGWFIGSATGGQRIFYHPGDNPGYRSVNAWFPDDDVRLAVLSNEDTADLDPIVHKLIKAAFPEGEARFGAQC